MKNVSSPALPESNMTDEEAEQLGVLQNDAAKALMRFLWLSRLCRPDLSFIAPVLHAYSDVDFASCPWSAKATSGIMLRFMTGESFFLVFWQSRKQSSVALSTPEAEVIHLHQLCSVKHYISKKHWNTYWSKTLL